MKYTYNKKKLLYGAIIIFLIFVIVQSFNCDTIKEGMEDKDEEEEEEEEDDGYSDLNKEERKIYREKCKSEAIHLKQCKKVTKKKKKSDDGF